MSESFYVIALCVAALVLLGLCATTTVALYLGRDVQLQADARIEGTSFSAGLKAKTAATSSQPDP